MLGKVFLTGKTFAETCQYLCEDLVRSEVLAIKGVREYDLTLMARDFETQHQFLPEKEKPVFHGALTFPPGEDPGDRLMVEIGQKHLQRIGMNDTQYAIVKHTDTRHLHMHILANRVGDRGQILGEGLIIVRSIKAAQALTREYGLREEEGKNLALTRMEALHETDKQRYRIFLAIQEALPGCREIEDLEKRLLLEGITTRYRMAPDTGARQGISFRLENIAFGGKQVDKAFSISRLEQTVQEQRLAEELKLKQVEELRLKQMEELQRQELEKQALSSLSVTKNDEGSVPEPEERQQQQSQWIRHRIHF